MKNKKTESLIFYLLSVIAIFGVWEVAAVLTNSVLIIPTPKLVFLSLVKLFKTPLFFKALLLTFYRVFMAFLIAVVLGFFLGVLEGISPNFKIFLSVPMSLVRATPVVALILIAVFWFGSEKVPSFVGILMSLPIVVTAVESAYSKADKKLLEMAEVYGFSFKQKLFYLRLPAVALVFESASISAFGMAWKVVVAGEVLTLPKNSLGNLLYSAQVHLESADVFAYTIVIVAMCFLCEKLMSFIFSLFEGKEK